MERGSIYNENNLSLLHFVEKGIKGMRVKKKAPVARGLSDL